MEEEKMNMKPYSREQYREECQRSWPIVDFCLAVMRRIPKKYEKKIIALFKAHPQVVDTHKIETCTAILGFRWRCNVAEVPELLRLMTARSKGDITYHLGDKQRSFGMPVTLTFTIPEAAGDQD